MWRLAIGEFENRRSRGVFLMPLSCERLSGIPDETEGNEASTPRRATTGIGLQVWEMDCRHQYNLSHMDCKLEDY
ncbi:hypothetical protein E3N88_07825 [Mikania micrantha]|uniref:Uncharacterized protein n=1 Tax=Mikania micrantha TaxID=192012 RepID=A0A5N6PEF3_9ASTR|nr:hypothetical protein E3N88_07825 [Mikania micrantha]